MRSCPGSAGADLGRALFAPVLFDPVQPPNHARFLFLNRHAGDFWRDWDQAADDAARNSHDLRRGQLAGILTGMGDVGVHWSGPWILRGWRLVVGAVGGR
jgi:hypothetical protein